MNTRTRLSVLLTVSALVVSLFVVAATADEPAGITSPQDGAVASLADALDLAASEPDATSVQWAVRYGTCDPDADANRAGNVTNVDDDYTFEDGQFSATVDPSTWEAGDYCFIFNPSPGGRYTVEFELTTEVIVVNENDLGQDWHVNITDGGTVAFIDDAGSPLGGALQLITSDTNPSRAQLNSDQDAGTLLADINNISYWTFKSSDSTGAEAHGPSINLAVTNTGADGTGGFTTLVFEPIYTPGYGGNAAYGDDEWKFWDASGEARWWSTNAIDGVCAHSCYVSFDDIKAANPHATIVGYAMNLGTWNPNIESRVDAFTVGYKTFDFEPAPPPKTADDCKNGGWETMTDSEDAEFRNQGDCVSYFASDGRTRGGNGR